MKAAIAVAAAALACPVCAFELCDSPGRAEQIRLDQRAAQAAFDEKRFNDVDQHYNAYLDAYEAGRISDAEARIAFHDFESSKPGREPLHTEWLWARPESRAARLAIGYHYAQRWIDAGNPADLKDALRAFELAEQKAGKPTLAIAARLRLAGERGNAAGVDAPALYREAIRKFPDTLEVRVQAAHAIRLGHGADAEQLQSILVDAKRLPAAQQRYVEYFVDQEMAAAMEESKHDEKAAELYDRSAALCRGLDSSLVRSLKVYRRLKRADLLETRANEYIKRRPRDGWGYAMRAWAEREQGRHAEAFPDYDRAVLLGEPSALQDLAWYFETGTNVPRDRRKALELYTIAADRRIEGGAENARRLRHMLGVARQ